MHAHVTSKVASDGHGWGTLAECYADTHDAGTDEHPIENLQRCRVPPFMQKVHLALDPLLE
jgi:hypothetical protein